MPLTPEQFNKLVTKDEFNDLKKDVKKIDGKIDRLLGAVEGIATKHKDFNWEWFPTKRLTIVLKSG